MINESTYPTLSWSSFRPGMLPENLQIGALDRQSLDYMTKSKSFNNFISLLGFDYYQGNNLRTRMKKEEALASHEPHRNLFLSEKAFQKVESNQAFRMKVWNSPVNVPSGSGSILFKKGGCYLYRILTPEDSEIYKIAKMTDVDVEKGSRYFAIALFIENSFICFEEGFIMPNGGISVAEGGYYPNGNDIGQYISFSLITLKAFWGNVFTTRSLPAKAGLNQSGQKVTFLE